MNKIKTLKNKIEAVRKKLFKIKEMRPGSLSQQNHKRGNKLWPYWQISFMHKGRSKTKYIRDTYLKVVKKELNEYKKFKKLMEEMIELNIELCEERMSEFIENENNQKK